MQQAARDVFEVYLAAYGTEVQGCCPVIADGILQRVGGETVAGELTCFGGSCRRTLWWVEKDGEILDPMGDWFLASEVGTGRQEHHRDRHELDAVLPHYERWRVPLPAAAGPGR